MAGGWEPLRTQPRGRAELQLSVRWGYVRCRAPPSQRQRPRNINPLGGNLQGCLSARYVGLDTNPLSHKSLKAERDGPSINSQHPSTCPPQVNAALTCVYVYTTSANTALHYPTASVPAGQSALICFAEGYEFWHFIDMTSRSFLN